MLAYIESFCSADRERLFRFLTLFARWECALKHKGFAQTGAHGQAQADWATFARDHEAAISAINKQTFLSARKALLDSPPKREVQCDNDIKWEANPRRSNESDAGYLFRVVKDVRNNLFHGGKFSGGPEPEMARDRLMVDSAITILEHALDLAPKIKAMLDEPPYSPGARDSKVS